MKQIYNMRNKGIFEDTLEKSVTIAIVIILANGLFYFQAENAINNFAFLS